jgi:hypothetical protein
MLWTLEVVARDLPVGGVSVQCARLLGCWLLACDVKCDRCLLISLLLGLALRLPSPLCILLCFQSFDLVFREKYTRAEEMELLPLMQAPVAFSTSLHIYT